MDLLYPELYVWRGNASYVDVTAYIAVMYLMPAADG
jgi:hypothetical protein